MWFNCDYLRNNFDLEDQITQGDMKSNITYLYLRPIHLSIYNHKLVASASLTELAAADQLLEKVVSSRSC
jgi:hypothetical protein